MWSTPVFRSIPLRLTYEYSQTNEFTLPARRFGVYLNHEGTCGTVLDPAVNLRGNYLREETCDIEVSIFRGPVSLFRQRTTQARRSGSGLDSVNYRLGYFSLEKGGKVTVIVSNVPSAHDDLACKAKVEIEEILSK